MYPILQSEFDSNYSFLLKNLHFPKKINKNDGWYSFVLGDYHSWNFLDAIKNQSNQYEHWCGEDNGVEFEMTGYFKQNIGKWVKNAN